MQKKLQGGVKLTPPPAGIGLSKSLDLLKRGFFNNLKIKIN